MRLLFLRALSTFPGYQLYGRQVPRAAQDHPLWRTTYSELQKRKLKWILVQAFRLGLLSGAKNEARVVPVNSSIRASAAEFRPNGMRVLPSIEVEDGEVKDNRAGNRPARGREPNLPKPPTPRGPARDINGAASKLGPQTTNMGRPITLKPVSTPVSTPGPRQEPPKFSTLPSGRGRGSVGRGHRCDCLRRRCTLWAWWMMHHVGESSPNSHRSAGLRFPS
ncbi:hypothetical protein B0I37DRAFT_240442 [Chaetomium sp. MPI-CAGE-AT-0009]|nr:hypothetical protein B0I37DRAFT_240442 [Chaetomium sp. MPI-CAGE-AT-0009]